MNEDDICLQTIQKFDIADILLLENVIGLLETNFLKYQYLMNIS